MTERERVAAAIGNVIGPGDDTLRTMLYESDQITGENAEGMLAVVDGLLEAAADAALSAMSPAWRPIESAPTDGTEVLVLGRPIEGERGPIWVDRYGSVQAGGEEGWPISVTHWMPLDMLRAPNPPPAWRPIPAEVREGEEPWDGEPLLLWNGHWRGVGMYNEPNYEGDPIWVDEHTEFIEPGPTHYMPLPAPPSAEEG